MITYLRITDPGGDGLPKQTNNQPLAMRNFVATFLRVSGPRRLELWQDDLEIAITKHPDSTFSVSGLVGEKEVPIIEALLSVPRIPGSPSDRAATRKQHWRRSISVTDPLAIFDLFSLFANARSSGIELGLKIQQQRSAKGSHIKESADTLWFIPGDEGSIRLIFR